MYSFFVLAIIVSAVRSVRKALPEIRESFAQMSKDERRAVLAEGKGRWAEVIFSCSYLGKVYKDDYYEFLRELRSCSARSFFKELKEECSKEEIAELFSAIEL